MILFDFGQQHTQLKFESDDTFSDILRKVSSRKNGELRCAGFQFAPLHVCGTLFYFLYQLICAAEKFSQKLDELSELPPV